MTVPIAHVVDDVLLRRRQDVRRLVDRRLEGHQRVRHDADAGCRRQRCSIRSSKRPTLILRCDVHRAVDDAGLRARPALAREALPRRYLKSTGIADRALFGPENEFFIFDNVRYGTHHVRARSSRSTRSRRRGAPASNYEEGNNGAPSGRQGRLLPGAAGRFVPGPALGDVPGAGRARA